jgi:hypothetical protein
MTPKTERSARLRRGRPAPPPLRSAGGGARRTIEWDRLDTKRLGPAGRKIVGENWLARMKQEHLAVGAFALLARELAELGCSPVVLSLITRASADEVRHADTCGQFAARLLGEDAVPARLRGLPHVPMHEAASASSRVLLHVVEMCCLSETLTGVYLTEMASRTSDAVARCAVESLLEDEIDHGRVGWAYLGERARAKDTEGLAEALPAMLDRTFRNVLGTARRAKIEDDRSLERYAYLGPRAGGEVCTRALRDVILPGFDALGVDLGPARSKIAAREWLQS